MYSIKRFCGSVKRKSGTASVNTDSQWSKQEAFLHVRLGCGSLSITTPASLLANEFDVRSVLHGQVSLAAVNQICLDHEAVNGCKNLKSEDSLLRKCKYLPICYIGPRFPIVWHVLGATLVSSFTEIFPQ